MRLSIILIGLGLGLVFGLSTNVRALDVDVKCNAAKVKEAAKYSACLLKAESKAIKKGEVADLSKCDSKFSEKWQKAESKAGGECPTENDEAAIQAQVQQCADDLVAALDPGSCPGPGAAVGGACWYLSNDDESCGDVCGGLGLAYNFATQTYAGNTGTLANCLNVMDALGQTDPPLETVGDVDCGAGVGCTKTNTERGRCTDVATTVDASLPFQARVCACFEL